MKMSRQTKEIVKVVLFFVIVGLALTIYVIYPLNRTEAAMARETDGSEDSGSDSLVLVNDPTPFLAAGLHADTFRVEADGLTTLSCLYILPDSIATPDSVAGTVFLIPSEETDRTAMLPLSSALVDSGFSVVTYDPRATGGSTGEYHGEGRYEANDLEALLAWLVIRNRLIHPVTVVGGGLGADAALLAALEESRIDRVIAWRPHLTTSRWLDRVAEREGWLWFPFRRTVMWFWYNLRSGYAAPYRDMAQLAPVACPTVLVLPESGEDETVRRLRELSDDSLLTIKTTATADFERAQETIIGYIAQSR